MARATALFRGFPVVVTRDLPKRHVADEIKPVWCHPLIDRLRRLFGRPVVPWLWVPGQKVEEEIACMAAGKLFISPRMLAELRRSSAVNGSLSTDGLGL